MSVGPSWAHSVMWWASQRYPGTWQPGWVQPRRQLLGIGDPAPRRPLTNMQAPRQHVGIRRATQLDRRGLPGDRRDQTQPPRRQPAPHHLQARQHRERLTGGLVLDRLSADSINRRHRPQSNACLKTNNPHRQNRPAWDRRNYWGERDLRAVNPNNSAPLWSRIADASSADRPSSI